MMHRHFTISNFISASRVFLVIPMGYCLMTDFPNHRLWTAGIILFAVATDFLDGFLARKLHQVTDFGKIIDPVADKLGIGAYAIFLALTGDIPLWFIILVMLRDILIFLGGLYIHRKKGIVPQSNWPGKISVTCIAVSFFLATIQLEALSHILYYSLWVNVVLMLWSLWKYAKRLSIGRNVVIQK